MKRILAIIIAICAIITILPLNVFAVDDITKLTVENVEVNNKTYDGTKTASASVGTVNGVKGLDDVTVVATATFRDKNVGIDKTVDVTFSLTGKDAAKYEAPNSTTCTASISTAQIFVEGTTVADKTFDSNVIAYATIGKVSGIIDGDDVNVYVSANFSDDNAGKDKDVYIQYLISGKDSNNYEVPASTTATASITTDTNPMVDAGVKISADQDDLDRAAKEFTKAVGNNISRIELTAKSIDIEGNNNASNEEVALIEKNVKADKIDFYEITLNFRADDTLYNIGDENTVPIGVTYKFDFTGKKDVTVHRVHKGKYEELTTTPNDNGEYYTTDQDAGTITVNAVKYSTYAIAYNMDDQKIVKTGDNNAIIPFVAIALISLGAFVIIKKKTNKE